MPNAALSVTIAILLGASAAAQTTAGPEDLKWRPPTPIAVPVLKPTRVEAVAPQKPDKETRRQQQMAQVLTHHGYLHRPIRFEQQSSGGRPSIMRRVTTIDPRGRWHTTWQFDNRVVPGARGQLTALQLREFAEAMAESELLQEPTETPDRPTHNAGQAFETETLSFGSQTWRTARSPGTPDRDVDAKDRTPQDRLLSVTRLVRRFTSPIDRPLALPRQSASAGRGLPRTRPIR